MQKVLLFVLVIFLFSCSATRRETRVDNKAIGRVLSKAPLTEQVGKVYLGQHPIDQTPIYIKGKDSIIEKPIYIDVVRDKIIKEKYPDLNLDSLRNAVMRIVTILRTDTILTPDLKTIALLNAEYNSHATTTGQLTEVRDSNTILKKDLSRRTMWLYISIFAAIVIIGGMAYLLFKKKK